uniref:Putative secreted protein n=1 Tax=Anopheles darlingi TaxID=43151 RepID=A0A2M4D9Z9_ANODA
MCRVRVSQILAVLLCCSSFRSPGQGRVSCEKAKRTAGSAKRNPKRGEGETQQSDRKCDLKRESGERANVQTSRRERARS